MDSIVFLNKYSIESSTVKISIKYHLSTIPPPTHTQYKTAATSHKDVTVRVAVNLD